MAELREAESKQARRRTARWGIYTLAILVLLASVACYVFLFVRFWPWLWDGVRPWLPGDPEEPGLYALVPIIIFLGGLAASCLPAVCVCWLAKAIGVPNCLCPGTRRSAQLSDG